MVDISFEPDTPVRFLGSPLQSQAWQKNYDSLWNAAHRILDGLATLGHMLTSVFSDGECTNSHVGAMIGTPGPSWGPHFQQWSILSIG